MWVFLSLVGGRERQRWRHRSSLTPPHKQKTTIHGQHTPERIVGHGGEAEAPTAPRRPKQTSSEKNGFTLTRLPLPQLVQHHTKRSPPVTVPPEEERAQCGHPAPQNCGSLLRNLHLSLTAWKLQDNLYVTVMEDREGLATTSTQIFGD